MKNDTLYITDLDGTLFGQDAEVSALSAALLGEMLEQGLLFTVATARSAASAMKKLRGIRFTLPIAMMNGVLLYDTATGRYIHHEPIEAGAARAVAAAMDDAGQTAYVFTFAQHQLYANYKRLCTPFQNQFLTERQDGGLKKFVQVDDFFTVMGRQTPVFFSITGTYEELLPLCRHIEAETQGLSIMMYEDFLNRIWYLEIFSARASKAAASRRLAELCGARELVCFGDNYNDIDMLRAADRSYAVENAVQAAKEAATAVIGPNSGDAVARFIAQDWRRE